jgi:hypothetical protein
MKTVYRGERFFREGELFAIVTFTEAAPSDVLRFTPSNRVTRDE